MKDFNGKSINKIVYVKEYLRNVTFPANAGFTKEYKFSDFPKVYEKLMNGYEILDITIPATGTNYAYTYQCNFAKGDDGFTVQIRSISSSSMNPLPQIKFILISEDLMGNSIDNAKNVL